MKNKWGIIYCGIVMMTLLFGLCSGQNQLSFEVGATGDDASRGNMGIRAGIQTHIYDTYPVVFDYFWIGSVLANGAFIQFGYGFQPGPAAYCLKAFVKGGVTTCMGKSELVSNTEGRWEWQYWPDIGGHDFYYEIGPANSVGINGSWQEYSIVRSNSEWDFVLGDVVVGNLTAPSTLSRDPPLMVAEKTGTYQLVGSLGPVEFRGLEYLKQNGWQEVESLLAVRSCPSTQNCNLDQPYGVDVVDDHVVAGSVLERPRNGALLWTSGFVTLKVVAHPNAHFSVWTFAGQQLFIGNASVEVPKGMFAYVSLIDTNVPASGLPGALGTKDEFQGWIGSRSSNDASLQILMENDYALQATWRSDYLASVVILASILVIVGILTFSAFMKRRVDANRVSEVS
jgi:hypothetical protein